jgi:hypothetical protein
MICFSYIKVIMSPKIVGRPFVFAFAEWLSVRIKLVRASQVKLLMGFQPNFTGVISTIPCYVHHIPLRCQKADRAKK